ncbi:MAG: MFS transporter [Nanoarchaeota archaeon]
MQSEKRGRKNILLFGGSSFFNDVGSEMITPLLPFYVTQLGGGGVAVGLLSGLREGLSSIAKLIGGFLSDREGKRKPVIFLGYLISSLLKLLLFFTNSWQQVLAVISFERIGKTRDAPRDAVIAISTKKKGNGFGIHQMMDSMGAIVGISILILLFWKLNLDYKTIFIIAGLIASLSLIPLFFVKEPKYEKNKENIFKSIKGIDRRLKYFIFVSCIFTLGNFGLYMFLVLLAKEITGSVFASLFFVLIFNLFFSLFSVYFGNMSDRIGRKKVLILGYTLFILVCVQAIFIRGEVFLALIFASYGLVNAITSADQRAFVADLSGKNKGTAIGFYNMVVGLVNIPAGIIAGIFWNMGSGVMFVYLSVVALVSLILLLFVKA